MVFIVVRRRRENDSRGGYTAGGSTGAFATTRDDYKPIVRGDFSSSASSTPSGTEV